MPQLAEELVKLDVDVIVAAGTLRRLLPSVLPQQSPSS